MSTKQFDELLHKIPQVGEPNTNFYLFVYSHKLRWAAFIDAYPSAKFVATVWTRNWEFHINQHGKENLRPVWDFDPRSKRPTPKANPKDGFPIGTIGYLFYITAEEDFQYHCELGPSYCRTTTQVIIANAQNKSMIKKRVQAIMYFNPFSTIDFGAPKGAWADEFLMGMKEMKGMGVPMLYLQSIWDKITVAVDLEHINPRFIMARS